MKPIALVQLGFATAMLMAAPLNTPPAGYKALFNGADLTGWRGLKGDYSPHIQATLTPDALSAMQVQWNADRDLHWSVDK